MGDIVTFLTSGLTVELFCQLFRLTRSVVSEGDSNRTTTALSVAARLPPITHVMLSPVVLLFVARQIGGVGRCDLGMQ